MIFSMTGFSAATRDTPNGVLMVELRSVNSRYLDLSFRLDDALRALEPALREAIAAQVGRGKLECRLSLVSRQDGDTGLQLNTALVRQLVELGHLLQEYTPESRSLGVADILRWPGVVGGAAPSLGKPARALSRTAARRPGGAFRQPQPRGRKAQGLPARTHRRHGNHRRRRRCPICPG